jgi:diguanylate cyclase (GGDEF)-like protein
MITGMLTLLLVLALMMNNLYEEDLFIKQFGEYQKSAYSDLYVDYSRSENLEDLLYTYSRKIKGFVTVFDDNYQIVETTAPIFVNGSDINDNIHKVAEAFETRSEGGIMLFQGEDFDFKAETLILFGVLPDGNWLMIEKPIDFMNEAIKFSNKTLYTHAISVFIIGTVLVYGMSYHFTTPILEISRVSKAIASLDFDAKVQISNRDEIGDLGKMVNRISDKLRDAMEELEMQNLCLQDDKEELERLNQALTITSETDPLTKLYNRLKIDEILARVTKKSLNGKLTYSIIIVDVDHFKLVNDTFGHMVGDDVLKTLAGILEKFAGPEDLVGRWGGEEFIFVLPQKRQDQAYHQAESIRNYIEAYQFDEVGSKTVSLGVGEYTPDYNLDEFISLVDQALYKAKLNGRNRVEEI